MNWLGVKFNIASPKQLGEVLFDNLKLDPKAKKTKTGQYQTGEEVLSMMVNLHPLPQKVLDFRQVQKIKVNLCGCLAFTNSPFNRTSSYIL